MFQDGDVFRIVVPLDDGYSFDMGIGSATKGATDATKGATNYMITLTQDERSVLDVIRRNPEITQKHLHEVTGIALGTIKRLLPRLQEKGILERIGNRRSGKWQVND